MKLSDKQITLHDAIANWFTLNTVSKNFRLIRGVSGNQLSIITCHGICKHYHPQANVRGLWYVPYALAWVESDRALIASIPDRPMAEILASDPKFFIKLEELLKTTHNDWIQFSNAEI